MTLGDKVSQCFDFHVHIFSSKLLKTSLKQYKTKLNLASYKVYSSIL